MEVNMKITKYERELLLFMALGDGHLDKRGVLSIVHCEKQKEYIEWKYNLIKKFTTKQGIRYLLIIHSLLINLILPLIIF